MSGGEGRSRPPLGTQARTVYDYAEEWHDQHGHEGDVWHCAECRRPDGPRSDRSPYGVALEMFFSTDGQPKDPR